MRYKVVQVFVVKIVIYICQDTNDVPKAKQTLGTIARIAALEHKTRLPPW